MKKMLTVLVILAYSLSSMAKTFVLVAHESTPPKDIESLLKKQQNLVSLIELIKAEKGTVTRDLLQKVSLNSVEAKGRSEFQSTNPTSLIEEITYGFLSPLRKRLLIETLQSFPSAVPASQENLQIEALLRSPLTHTGNMSPNLSLFRKDDQIYLNGYPLAPEDLGKLKLYENLFYHLAYLSQTSLPTFLWIRGKDLKIQQPKPIVLGTCKSPSLSGLDIEDRYLALFPNGCSNSVNMRTLPETEGTLPSHAETEQALAHAPQKSKQHLWIGGGVLLFSLLIKEASNHYDILIKVPF